MKRERWRTILFLIILFVISLFVRLFFLKANKELVNIDGNCYHKALISDYGIYRIQSFSIDELYTKLLSISLLIFGNHEISGVYLNIFLQIISVVILYFAIGLIANTYVTFGIVAVISVLPYYRDKIYEISAFNLLIFIYAIGLFILSIMSKYVYTHVEKKKTTEQENGGLMNAEKEKTGVITLDDIIGENKNSLQTDLKKEELLKDENKSELDTEIIPPGMKEIILDEEEKKKKVKFIENPLPVPKRHEHKEMDFAIGLREDNDDYDIKDVSGMDFFDIE